LISSPSARSQVGISRLYTFLLGAYGYLFVVGTYSKAETDEFIRSDGCPTEDATGRRTREFWIPVESLASGTVLLQGFRLANAERSLLSSSRVLPERVCV